MDRRPVLTLLIAAVFMHVAFATKGEPSNISNSTTKPTTTTTTTKPANTTHCGPVHDVKGGDFSGVTSTTVNSTATLMCYAGYNISGNGTIVCQENETWTESPSCAVINCSIPQFANGIVNSTDSVSANNSVTFSCNSGFEMSGKDTTVCNSTGFLEHVPTCILKSVRFEDMCNVTLQCQTKDAKCNESKCVCPKPNLFYRNSTDSCEKVPTCIESWYIENVTTTSFTFVHNQSSVSFEFYAISMNDLESFEINNKLCTTEFCTISLNVTTLQVTGLKSGLMYNISFKTAKEKDFNISYEYSDNICQIFHNYTVPELPECIEIPTDNITASSFLVRFSKNTTNAFLEWRVDVYNESDIVSTKTETRENNIININTSIEAATEYNVTVVSTVLEHTSSATTFRIFTRPTDSKPAILANISTNSITLLFNNTLPSYKYTHVVVLVNDSSITFSGVCSSQSLNCTFERPTNFSEVRLSTLTPGTLYNVEIYTSIGGMPNIVPQVVSSFTAPNSVSEDNMKIASVTNSSIRVTWETVTGTFNGYNVTFTCKSPNVNSSMQMTYNSSVLSNEASVFGLDPGTFCNVSVKTFLVNKDYGIIYGDNVVEKKLLESTKEEAPGNVDSQEILNKTARSCILHWSAPNTRNGIIRYYIVWITDSSQSCVRLSLWNCSYCGDYPPVNISILEVPPCPNNETDTFSHEQLLSWSIQELHPFRNYTAYIAAYTVDMGSRINVTISTLEDFPGMPVGLKDTDTTNSSIKMQWLAPEERNGIVMSYTVTYKYYERECRHKDVIKNISEMSNKNESVLTKSIYPYWTYNISVKATNKIGSGNYSDVYQVNTTESDPDIINEINSTYVFARNATIKWLNPCFANGVLTHFYVEIKNATTRGREPAWVSTAKVKAPSTELVVQALLPFRNYSVRVLAENKAGNGTYNTPFAFQTAIDVPETPAGLRQNQTNSSSIKVSWDPAKHYTGPTKYNLTVTDMKTNTLVKSFNTTVGWWFDELATEALIDGLDAYWNYSIAVTAVTSSGDQESRYSASSVIYVRTAEDVPGPVTNLTVRNETDLEKPRRLFVTWEPPTEKDLNGIILRYDILCSNRDQKFSTSASIHSYPIPLFIDNKVDVSVKVWAVTSFGRGTLTEYVIPVSPGAPEHPKESKADPLTKRANVPVDDDEKMIAVKLPTTFLCNHNNGKPTQWGVIVAQDGTENEIPFIGSIDEYEKKKTIDYKTWYQVKDEDKMRPYVATSDWNPLCVTENKIRRRRSTEEDIETLNFIVGNEDCSNNNENCNGPLHPGRSYRVKSYACTTTGCTETFYSQPIQTAPNLIPAIVGGLASAVVVIAIVAVIVYTKRTHKLCFSGKTVESGQSGGDIEIADVETPSVEYTFKPCSVKLSEFSAHVDRMHRDSDLLFADAFKMLRDKSPSYPVTVAESQNCRPRNRYTNIMPFDHSRVKLCALDDVEGSDFINANFIPGYSSGREYIATQGPMQMTFDDFWRMIWEQNVDTIVMLTKLTEKGRSKCDQYWPNLNEPVFYGELVVSIQSESNLSDYTLRIFEIKTSKGPSRIVKHFWYLKWPDMGCPDDPQMLLDFVKAVKEHTHRPGRTSPTVVHCSAGVGRTGTFIAVDHLLQYIRDHDDVDIFQLVMDMREHRSNMVQTEDQFIYIHECLKAFITNDEEEEEPVYQNAEFGAENVYENAGFQKEYQLTK